MGKFIDLAGNKFERLYVMSQGSRTYDNHIKWICKCDCGNIIEVDGRDLRSGKTKSCSCLLKEKASKRIVKQNTTHGQTNTRLYHIWQNMLDRCRRSKNKNYIHYGGRGIKVCKEWENDFINFYDWAISNGYKENLTIDRINVNGNYEPSNCRWITIQQQAFNKRTNYFITYNDIEKTITQWEKYRGYKKGTIANRLRNNWNIKRAIEEVPYIGKNQYFIK